MDFEEFLWAMGNDVLMDIIRVSDVDGEEVAQVYVEYPWDSWNIHPLRELRA